LLSSQTALKYFHQDVAIALRCGKLTQSKVDGGIRFRTCLLNLLLTDAADWATAAAFLIVNKRRSQDARANDEQELANTG
jgi:hypothetical protein